MQLSCSPRRGVQTLRRLHDALVIRRHRSLPALKRSSTAIVLRLVGLEDPPAGAAYEASVGAFLASPRAARLPPDVRLEVLYMRRTENVHDSWSGQVSFPGGRQSAADGGDDRATAVRETLEEVGLDLRSPGFLCLGRLDDRAVMARGRHIADMCVCPHVFLQTRARTPPLRLQSSEVAAVRWAPADVLTASQVDPWRVFRSTAGTPLIGVIPSAARRAFSIDTVFFPSILLPPPSPPLPGCAPRADADTDGDSVALACAGIEFRLWGMTLAMTSDLFALAAPEGTRPDALGWPPAQLGNPAIDFFIRAACGAAELRDGRSIRVPHVAAAALLAGAIVGGGAALAARL